MAVEGAGPALNWPKPWHNHYLPGAVGHAELLAGAPWSWWAAAG